MTMQGNGVRRRAGGHPGQALVESALAFPLLLLTGIGLVQFAIFAHAQHVVTIAVQEGARAAAAEDRALDEGVAYAQTLLLAGLGSSADGLTIHAAADGLTVVMEAQGQLRTMIPWVTDVALPLRARATVQKEAFHAGPLP